MVVDSHPRRATEIICHGRISSAGLPWSSRHCAYEQVALIANNSVAIPTNLERTTTFMVLYDMLRNATRVSLEDIVSRQKILSHGYDVLQPAERGNRKAHYMADGPHLSAHFMITPAQIPTADSFGASGENLVRSDCVLPSVTPPPTLRRDSIHSRNVPN